MQDFFRELKDRKVIKVGIAYVVGAFVVMESADIMFPAIGLPESAVTLVVGLLIVGFPLTLVLTWAFDITPDGIKRAEVVKSSESADLGPSIAVVPFPDMSAEQDQEHFCDGLTEELLNVLTCIPGLRVASRTSSFSLKGKQITRSTPDRHSSMIFSRKRVSRTGRVVPRKNSRGMGSKVTTADGTPSSLPLATTCESSTWCPW